MSEFKIKKEHVALLQAMSWHWDECNFGAPRVNGKRPFGYSYDLEGSIRDILGDAADKYTDEELVVLYNETLPALEHILETYILQEHTSKHQMFMCPKCGSQDTYHCGNWNNEEWLTCARCKHEWNKTKTGG